MKQTAFEQLVVEVLESLPPDFARYLDEIDVIVERRPNREHRRALGIKPWQTVYGYFEGVPLTERSSLALPMPNMIYIFQEPLERDFRRPDLLREEVRRTVLHEIAHFFGISDDRLHELGAY